MTVREILASVLSQWAGVPVCLKESTRGPTVEQTIGTRSCFISISYSGTSAWVAISLEAEIGVDAVEIEAFEQFEDVESIYLSTVPESHSYAAGDQNLRFALRWSAMEARFKRVGLPIQEHTGPPEATVHHIVHGKTVVAIALPQKLGHSPLDTLVN